MQQWQKVACLPANSSSLHNSVEKNCHFVTLESFNPFNPRLLFVIGDSHRPCRQGLQWPRNRLREKTRDSQGTSSTCFVWTFSTFSSAMDTELFCNWNMPAPVSGAQAFLQECWQMLSPEDDLMQLQTAAWNSRGPWQNYNKTCVPPDCSGEHMFLQSLSFIELKVL